MYKEEPGMYPRNDCNEAHAKHATGVGINCPMFQRQEIAILDITNKINQAREVREKARFCEELEKETAVLFNCPDYEGTRLDCRSCYFIATLRKKSATLIMKAKKLS